MNTRIYWSEEQEQLVKDYLNELEVTKRSIIYSKLHPSITKIVKGVLHRYFHHFLTDPNDDQDLINDCIGYLMLYPFNTFNQSKGKAYAFFGTSAKHYFHTHFIGSNNGKYKGRVKILPVEDEEGNIIYDVVDQSSTNSMEDYLQLKENAKRLIISKLNATLGGKRILKHVLNLVDMYEWSKHYATYYLITQTGMNHKALYLKMLRFELSDLIHTKYSKFYYQKLIKENNLTTEQEIKTFLNKHEIPRKENKENYKIQNGAETRAKKLQTKRIRKSVGQSI